MEKFGPDVPTVKESKKITASYLKKLIQEEMNKMNLLSEAFYSAGELQKLIDSGSDERMNQNVMGGGNPLGQLVDSIKKYMNDNLGEPGKDAAGCLMGYMLSRGGNISLGQAIEQSLKCAKKYDLDVNELASQWKMRLDGNNPEQL